MTVSLINISCCKCKEEIQGYLEESPVISTEYSVNCTLCNQTNFFSNKAGWIQQTAPEGASKITRVNS